MKLCTSIVVLGLVGLLIGTPLAPGQDTPAASRPARAPVQQPEEATAAGPVPRLELSATEWDFGMKWHGEPCSTEVTIGNSGEAPLKILKVRSSCGCTVANPKKRELLPGESDIMTLTYNTKRNRRQVSQTITLETNDPRQPRVKIHVKGEVKQVFEAKPASRLIFGRVERDAVATESIELRNNMEEKVFLKLKPFSEPPPFDIKLEEIEPGMVYKLIAATKPPLKLGANTATVVLETGVEQFPTLTFPVSAYIAPRVAVTPAKLYVSLKVAQPFKRIVRVQYRSDQPVAITKIKSSHPDLIKAELRPPREQAGSKMIRRFHEIQVTLPPGKDLPAGGGQLEIYTDDPSPDYQKLVVDIVLPPTRPRAARPTRPKPGTVRPAPGPKGAAEDLPSKPKSSEERGEVGAP